MNKNKEKERETGKTRISLISLKLAIYRQIQTTKSIQSFLEETVMSTKIQDFHNKYRNVKGVF